MARIGIHILTKNCSWEDGESAFSKTKRFHCKYCTFEENCALDKSFIECPYPHPDNKTVLENCTEAGFDLDEVCKQLALQDPEGIKEILLELAGVENEHL